MKLRTCIECGTKKVITDFPKTFLGNTGRTWVCERCLESLGSVARYEAGKDIRYQRMYGITLQKYNAVYDQQEGRCAICGNDDCDLVVDHNHGTGVFRGLLCGNCNTGIGLLQDDPDVLEEAIQYLLERGYSPKT